MRTITLTQDVDRQHNYPGPYAWSRICAWLSCSTSDRRSGLTLPAPAATPRQSPSHILVQYPLALQAATLLWLVDVWQ